jgi:DNA polymerase III gamma/tau subunit
MTLANINRPLLFSEYIGQEGSVNYLKSVVEKDKHSNGLLITGNPGIGKTSLAYLYVKATLCEQREEGSSQACGKCPSCLAEIEKSKHPNITYYRITEATVFKEAVNDLINITKAPPVVTHDNVRTDNHKRFIIIDEVQSASKQSISPFLDSLEFAVKDVIVILISMNLNTMDSIVRDAIESRCIELTLNSLTTEQISLKLQEVNEDLHPDAADLIAYLAYGNVRKAWSLLEYFSSQFNLEELTDEIISNQKLNGLNQKKCVDILQSLQVSKWEDSEKLINQLLNTSTQSVDYFLTYLIKENLNFEGIKLISALSIWLQSDYKIPITGVFRMFQGSTLIQIDPIEPLPSTSFSSNKPPKKSSLHALNSITFITDRLETISGKSLHIDKVDPPTFLSFDSWSTFLNIYASNN